MFDSSPKMTDRFVLPTMPKKDAMIFFDSIIDKKRSKHILSKIVDGNTGATPIGVQS